MAGCCSPATWWSPQARGFYAFLDLLEFGCVLALIILNALYLLNFQQGACYLDGYAGYTDLTVCYSVFWATVVAAVVGFSVAILQLSTCCFTSIGSFLELIGSAALSVWWALVAVYWNHTGAEANAVGMPHAGPRLAVMTLPWVLAAAYVAATFISTGRFFSMCCYHPEVQTKYQV
jgi:hypothetical protein